MKIAYFDCIAGASGDMILGALLDAGLSLEALQSGLNGMQLPGYALRSRAVSKNGLHAIKLDVVVDGDLPARHLPDILKLVDGSQLPKEIRSQAHAIFLRIGEVEAGIHGVSVDQVHLHELGGVDTLVDVVGTLVGLRSLGVEKVFASPLPLGRGFIQSAHGSLPLPAPATVALLQGVPVTGSSLDVELVTPTGAALLAGLACEFGPLPPMRLIAAGYGAGGRDLPIPNVLRVLLGEATSPEIAGGATVEHLELLETNIDDLNPEIYDYLMARLLASRALDVFLAPIQMKKNRPALLLSVLCRPADADALMRILFSETSTLGVRRRRVERHALPRAIVQVETNYGAVRVKAARLEGGEVKLAPEYEDCRRLAEARGAPLREIYQAAAMAAAQIEFNEELFSI